MVLTPLESVQDGLVKWEGVLGAKERQWRCKSPGDVLQVQAGLPKPWRHRGLRNPHPGSALQWPSGPSKEKMLVSASPSTPAAVSTRSWELSLFARHLIKTISLKETKMESFTSRYSSAFWHLFPHQLGCKLVIRRAIQWLCSREALQHMCHLPPGRQVEAQVGWPLWGQERGPWGAEACSFW